MKDAKDPSKASTIAFRLRPETIRDLIRRLAADTANISWSAHALDRMSERGITDKMVVEVLRHGLVKGAVEGGKRAGEWKAKMVWPIRGRREVGAGVDRSECAPFRKNGRMGRPDMTKLQFIMGGKRPDGDTLHYTACGLDDVYLVNGFKREVVDGEEFITIENLDSLWKAIGLHLVTTRKVLAPKEIKFLRDHMNLTQAELGARLRVSDQTVARWEKGETKDVPGPADLMLRVFFLASACAQPEGYKILEKVAELCEKIIACDELQPKRAVFRHLQGAKRWREAELQLAC